MSEQKIALVTGGVGGLGTAICQTLATQGARVFANYYPAEAELAKAWQQEQKAAGFDIDIIGADVSSYESCQEMVASITEQAGPVDILVNGAGITRDASIKNMEPEAWNAVINTNLNSVYNVTRQVFTGMTERGFGRVINISSVNGQRGQFGQANYAAAKAGMHGFSMSLAQEGARKGVTVNTISPGYISTAMTQAIPEDVLAKIVSGIPMGKMGQPEDIANAISFLASDAAGYITGANMPVNGGLFFSF